MTDALPELDADEQIRYGWQMTVPGMGEEGQRRLKAATVLVSRVGGVGGAAAQYLAAAGVGRIILMHGGLLRLDDLNRQMLMATAAVGTPRGDCAADRLREINPAVEVIVVPCHPTVDLARQWAATAHVVISAAPLFEERHALHDAAAHHGLPCVEAAMFQMEGYVTVVQPPLTASYRDWCPAQPAWWRRRFPVFGAVAGTIGSLAAVETLKLLTGIGRPLHGRLTHIDFASGRCREVKLPGPPAHGAGSERYPQIPDGSVSEQGGADCSALAHVEPMSGGNPLPIVSDILTSAGKSPTDRENA